MIAGVAQLVVNVAEIAPAESELIADGYARTFEQRAIPNHPDKKAFTSVARSALDMVHLAAPSPAVAVELTAYAGAAPSGIASYSVGRGAAGARQAELGAGDPDGSREFWTAGLGLRPQHHEGDGELLELPALAPALRQRVLLGEGGLRQGATSVDAAGCVLVTLITTAIARDLDRAASLAAGGRSAGPWTENIGGRDINVAMVEGPSGELVELIEVPRTS